jgi:hypothetical protein
MSLDELQKTDLVILQLEYHNPEKASELQGQTDVGTIRIKTNIVDFDDITVPVQVAF